MKPGSIPRLVPPPQARPHSAARDPEEKRWQCWKDAFRFVHFKCKSLRQFPESPGSKPRALGGTGSRDLGDSACEHLSGASLHLGNVLSAALGFTLFPALPPCLLVFSVAYWLAEVLDFWV